jgi:hypothetical protein
MVGLRVGVSVEIVKRHRHFLPTLGGRTLLLGFSAGKAQAATVSEVMSVFVVWGHEKE